MKIFLTGASGNAGWPVAQELLRRGHDVHALVRSESTQVPPGCRTHQADLQNLETARESIAGCHAIIHLASPRSVDREEAIAQDIRPMSRLLEYWRQGSSQGPFIYASSQTVYGIPQGELEENHPLDAANWYDIAKICNEFQLRVESGSRMSARVGASIRMALLFGHGPRLRDRQFLTWISDQCRLNRTFRVDTEEAIESYGSSFIGEEDFARGMADALGLGRSGAYNLSGGFCTWRELIECLNRQHKARAQLVVRSPEAATSEEIRLPQSRSYLPTGKFEAGCGFTSRQTLGEIVEKHARADVDQPSMGERRFIFSFLK